MSETIDDSVDNSSYNILLVEDDEDVRGVYSDILKSVGYSTTDLIILDKGLPGMSGEEFENIIRSKDSSVKIIISSGNCSKESETRDCLQKPCGMNYFLGKVGEVLKREYCFNA